MSNECHPGSGLSFAIYSSLLSLMKTKHKGDVTYLYVVIFPGQFILISDLEKDANNLAPSGILKLLYKNTLVQYKPQWAPS